MGPSDYDIVRQIGKGAFGSTLLVNRRLGVTVPDPVHGEQFIMKVMSKGSIAPIERSRAVLERKIMTHLEHPNIVKAYNSFQTESDIYIIMDYYSVGDLSHLKVFEWTEKQVQFVAAEIVLCLIFLHRHLIIQRDIKPENILVHRNGHIAVTDFGLSKQLESRTEHTRSFCGTLEFMAPEVLDRYNGYTFNADYWSLGILIYDMMTGMPPFHDPDGDRVGTVRQILEQRILMPNHFSMPMREILKGFLKRNPRRRLGRQPDGEFKLKRHIFFAELDFTRLYRQTHESPILNLIRALRQPCPNNSRVFRRPMIERPNTEDVTNERLSGFDFTPSNDTFDFAYECITEDIQNINLDEQPEPPASFAEQSTSTTQSVPARVTSEHESRPGTSAQKQSAMPNSEDEAQSTDQESIDDKFDLPYVQIARIHARYSCNIAMYHEMDEEPFLFPISYYRVNCDTIEIGYVHYKPYGPEKPVSMRSRIDKYISLKHEVTAQHSASPSTSTSAGMSTSNINHQPRNLTVSELALSERQISNIVKSLLIMMIRLFDRQLVLRSHSHPKGPSMPKITMNMFGYTCEDSDLETFKLVDFRAINILGSTQRSPPTTKEIHDMEKTKRDNLESIMSILQTLIYRDSDIYDRNISTSCRGFVSLFECLLSGPVLATAKDNLANLQKLVNHTFLHSNNDDDLGRLFRINRNREADINIQAGFYPETSPQPTNRPSANAMTEVFEAAAILMSANRRIHARHGGGQQ